MGALSEITNLLLAFSILEDTDARVADVDGWLVRNEQRPLKSVWENGECCGGPKRMDAPLYAGAFNYLPLREFLVFLRTLQWSQPDEVQVILRGPSETGWRVVAA